MSFDPSTQRMYGKVYTTRYERHKYGKGDQGAHCKIIRKSLRFTKFFYRFKADNKNLDLSVEVTQLTVTA